MNGAGREREHTKRSSLILNSKTVYVLPWQLPWALWLFLVYCSVTLIFFRINLTCSYPLKLGVSFPLNSPSSQRVMERGLRMEKWVRGFASVYRVTQLCIPPTYLSPGTLPCNTICSLFTLVFSSLEWVQLFLSQ